MSGSASASICSRLAHSVIDSGSSGRIDRGSSSSSSASGTNSSISSRNRSCSSSKPIDSRPTRHRGSTGSSSESSSAPGASAAMRGRRFRCRGAIVGSGHLGAAINVPLFGRAELRSPLSLFNGPRQDGNPTVIAHAQVGFPIFETYVIVIPIERRSGTYGYRASFDIPPIAGGLGALTHIDATVDRRYRFHGAERSYVSARCSDFILQTQGYFSFTDGTVFYGSVFKPCQVAG